MNQEKRIEGFFIEFTGKEIEEIKERLKELGYPQDNMGIRECLLDALFVEDNEHPEHQHTEHFIEKLQNYVSNNPEKVRAGIDTMIGLVRMAGRRYR